ncbi:MAG: fibrobacter succinogenes major paralogous domain-containing protein, partial [Dysgonamonadaceae bacterium]|nr:fibrobacter succinogenes major paralogous domain-containing protein [Dysgonamonadaceae bacterium]
RQGICPDGWTLPSDYDWNQLEKEIATYPGLYSTESDTITPAAWESKYEGATAWRPDEGNTNTTWWGRRMKSPTSGTGANGKSKTDGTGFNALLVGVFVSGKGAYFDTTAAIWSSSAGSATAAWRRSLVNGNSGVDRDTRTKDYLFGVRCKK